MVGNKSVGSCSTSAQKPTVCAVRSKSVRRRAPLVMGIALSAAALMGFLIGLGVARRPAVARTSQWTPYQKLDEFAKVLHHIEVDYVARVDGRRLIHNAIRGMLERLDPHSRFFSKQQYRKLLEATTGVYAGVGITVEKYEGVYLIEAIQKKSPAEKAGLKVEDRLLSVDGRHLLQMTGAAVARLLRGKSGTKVKLKVMRRGWKKPRLFTLQRKLLRHNVVSGMLLCKKVVYMRIAAFHPGTSNAVNKVFKKLRKKVGTGPVKLILDLRSNPGGLMTEGLHVADLFISKGLLVVRKGKKGKLHEKYWAKTAHTFRGVQIAVVVDGRTASAAEIVAAALQDHGLAEVVGRRTFGKGSFQELIRFSEGSVLKLTVGRYHTPRGKSLDGRGIEPDVVVPTGPPSAGLAWPCKVAGAMRYDASVLKAWSVLQDASKENE